MKLGTILLVIAIVGLAAWAVVALTDKYRGTDGAESPSYSATPTASVVSVSPSLTISSTNSGPKITLAPITLNLNAQNGSQESGTVKLVDINGSMRVEIVVNATSVPANTEQPAHIHMGTCQNIGAVQFPLNAVVNGRSTTVVDIDMTQLKTMLPLAVNIHKSLLNSVTYVSCGNVKF